MTDETQTITQDWDQFWQDLGWGDDRDREDEEQSRLDQRAVQYAKRPPIDEGAAADQLRVLVFRLGVERYAVDVVLVQGVRKVEAITPVPGTPDFYRGVVNIRGQIVTVLDIRRFFDMQHEGDDGDMELLILRSGGLELALLTHRVQDVITVSLRAIESVDDVRYARGVTQDRIVILDIARMFEDDRLIVGGKDE